jgi:predicted dehydrogenase
MALRGAISGFGEVAERAHLAGWRTRPDVNIVAIHEPIAQRRHHALRLFPNLRAYDDLELMLEGERPDFVDVASPPSFHAAAARAALDAGAHVLVEKPLCLDSDEFAELTAAAASRRRVLMCVHNWKHSAAYRAAHELVAAGRLGDIRYISLERLRNAPAGVSLDSGGRWRLAAESGGGILIDHGWHAFYLMRWLIGGSDPLAVSAWLGKDAAASVEEVADVRVIFPGERVASAHLSWRSPIRRTHALLYGDSAMLEIDNDRVALTNRSGSSEIVTVRSEIDDSYHSAWFGQVAASFERAIAEGPDSLEATENLAEARVALSLTLGARQSTRKGGDQLKLV